MFKLKCTLLLSVITLINFSRAAQIYYFAYGSNLLARRIHILNPTAAFYSAALLENYRLDFAMPAKLWHGAVATICEDPQESVWGALWTIDSDQIPNLDNQEGVHLGWYVAKNVTVHLPDGTAVVARTYQITTPAAKIAKGQPRPADRTPSKTYLDVITIGAKECGIPASYIKELQAIPNNGNLADKSILVVLGESFYNPKNQESHST